MKIGNLAIPKIAALAPMAGIGDRAFREICVAHGAAYTVAEMCSAKGITYGSQKSAELLETFPAEQPCAVQLFGDEASIMGKAVAFASQYNPIVIDLNMGCPAPKIAGGGSGCALMKDMPLAEDIIRAAVRASSVPITVKFRKGWDENSVNAVDFAKMAEAAGASAIAIHGRTKVQMYLPPVDLDIIKAVKGAVSIPVIGNGGITTPKEAKHMYDYTGCDLIMIGQGVLGRPWLFSHINAYLEDGTILPEPSLREKMEILRHHVELAVEYKGEKVALRESRTHAAWYIKGIYGAASLRHQAGQLATMADLNSLIREVLKTPQ